MLKPYKRAFTLAETIMTLFIVGLVVTAAIPMFTQRRSNAPALLIPRGLYAKIVLT